MATVQPPLAIEELSVLVPIEEVDVRVGTTDAFEFQQSCTDGQWVTYGASFGGAIVGSNTGVVVLMSAHQPDPNALPAPAIPVVTNINNPTGQLAYGFGFQARNSDCDEKPKSTAFDWVALAPHEGKPARHKALVIRGQTTHRGFGDQCQPNDWQSWEVAWSQVTQIRHVIVTASDTGATGTPCPAVGLMYSDPGAYPSGYSAFTLEARNSGQAGDCAFNWASFDIDPYQAHTTGIVIETQILDIRLFAPGDGGAGFLPDAEQRWDVYFSAPFAAPPVVLLTAHGFGASSDQHVGAPVGIAADVTPFGCLVIGKNTDCDACVAGFQVVALGCVACDQLVPGIGGSSD